MLWENQEEIKRHPKGSHYVAGRDEWVYAFVFFYCLTDSTCLHRTKRIETKHRGRQQNALSTGLIKLDNMPNTFAMCISTHHREDQGQFWHISGLGHDFVRWQKELFHCLLLSSMYFPLTPRLPQSPGRIGLFPSHLTG